MIASVLRLRYVQVTISIILLIGVFVFSRPIAQPVQYYEFADAREIFGIQNFWNVFSNIAFLIFGILGIRLMNTRNFSEKTIQLSLWSVFIGLFLTTFGSSYFHLNPNHFTLVIDRLPMTFSFIGLFCLSIACFYSIQLAQKIQIWLLVIAPLTVIYWYFTEILGQGDLRPYLVVQYGSILAIFFLLLRSKQNIGLKKYFWISFVLYFLAKICEYSDLRIFQLLPISGHSIKHFLAGLALYPVLGLAQESFLSSPKTK